MIFAFYLSSGIKLSSKVIIFDAFWFHSERVKHLYNSSRHRARTAHIVFNILWRFMVFQVSVKHYLMHKTWSILHSCSICRWIRTVKSKMEVEVLILFFERKEIVEIEHFIQSTSTIEVMHFAVSCM